MIGNDCLRHCAENTKLGRRRWSISNVCLTQGIWKGQHYAMYLLTLAMTIFFLSWAVVIVSKSAFLPPGLHTPVHSPHPATAVSNLHLAPPSSYDSHCPRSEHRGNSLGNRPVSVAASLITPHHNYFSHSLRCPFSGSCYSFSLKCLFLPSSPFAILHILQSSIQTSLLSLFLQDAQDLFFIWLWWSFLYHSLINEYSFMQVIEANSNWLNK